MSPPNLQTQRQYDNRMAVTQDEFFQQMLDSDISGATYFTTNQARVLMKVCISQQEQIKELKKTVDRLVKHVNIST